MMLFRLLKDALRRRTRRLLVTTLAVTTGASLAAALLGISLDITGQMGRELRAYGANILASPASGDLRLEIGGVPVRVSGERALLDENDLVKLKTIFWRHNIVGFAPYLTALAEVDGQTLALTGTSFDKPLTLPKGAVVRTGFAQSEGTSVESTFRTGVKTIAPWWKVDGAWVQDDDPSSAMVGAGLARRMGWQIGNEIVAQVEDRTTGFRIVGLVSSGGFEEDQIFVTLPAAQALLGLTHGVDRVQISALVEPDDKLRPDLRGLDPSEMTPEQYATWYCSPIMGAVLTQIKEVLPNADVRPIRQISQAEVDFLRKMGLLMGLLTLTALGGSALAVMTAMTASVTERRAEIGLMKALGADGGQIALIFLSEAALIGLAGGAAGYMLGLGLAQGLGRWVFSAGGQMPVVVLPITLLLALGVGLLGSALPVQQAMRFDPVLLLRGK
ncbi:MAG TPA: FtsX-like permease family protein [Anaerolineae bacterium]|nr:FtsX-like permease family protein [Anaerolineae bacterium]